MQSYDTPPALPVQDDIRFAHIPGYVGYAASDDGKIWTCRWERSYKRFVDWRMMIPQRIKGGYFRVGLNRDRKQIRFLVHRLVMLAFIGPCPENMECCHNDGNQANNQLANLRYATPIENAIDKRTHGAIAIGERCGTSKLTEETVRKIRRMRKEGYKLREIYEATGAAVATVQCIVYRKTWKHVV